jgi:hypothetical protein
VLTDCAVAEAPLADQPTEEAIVALVAGVFNNALAASQQA